MRKFLTVLLLAFTCQLLVPQLVAQCTFTIDVSQLGCPTLSVQTCDTTYSVSNTDSLVTITSSCNDPIVFTTNSCGGTSSFNISTTSGFDQDVEVQSNFFWLWITDCASLPVELIEFTSNKLNNINQLQWRSASEDNFGYYLVEYSTDGRNYIPLEIVFPNPEMSYKYLDGKFKENSRCYYRLKMVDLDYTFEYSEIVTIDRKDYDRPVQTIISSSEDYKGQYFDLNQGYVGKTSLGLQTGIYIYYDKQTNSSRKVFISNLK